MKRHDEVLSFLTDCYNTITTKGSTQNYRFEVKSQSLPMYDNTFSITYDYNEELINVTYHSSIRNNKIVNFVTYYNFNELIVSEQYLVIENEEQIFQQSLIDIPFPYDAIFSYKNLLMLRNCIKYYQTDYASDIFSVTLHKL